MAMLGDLCEVKRGSTITKKSARPGDVPVVAGGIDPAYFHDTPNRPANVITVSGSGANAGYVNFYDVPIWASDSSTIIPKDDRLSVRFVHFFLLAVQQFIYKELARGAAQPHVYPRDLAKILMPIPPVEEQRRIVSVLDEAFEGLARARAHAEANREDAALLMQRRLDQQINTLAAEFGRVRIGEVAAVRGGKRLPKGLKTKSDPTPYPYITVRDMTDDGTVSDERLGYISEEVQAGIARYTVRSRDVYVSIAGTIGKSGIVPEHLDGANLTENAAKLVLRETWSNEFIYWCTRSTDFADQARSQTRIAAQPKLALERLAAITVPKADATAQRRLSEAMLEFRDASARLRSSYAQKLAELENLRRSLLQKAVAGELT